MNSKRAYTMGARAKSVEDTGMRIVRAAFELQTERLTSQIGLDAVAERAEVSVQTVLRHFGSRAGLFDAAVEYGNAEVTEERRAPVGDVRAAIRILVDHYELRGDIALMMLAQETAHDHLRQLADAGKATHRRWVEDVFAPYLDDLRPAAREELTDLLVVATDVYTWKLLSRDRGLSRARIEKRIETLVAAILSAKAQRKDKRDGRDPVRHLGRRR